MFCTHHDGCGFAVFLPNEWMVSVSWAEGTYSSNYDRHLDLSFLGLEDKSEADAQNAYTAARVAFGSEGAEKVEIMIRDAQGNCVDMDGFESDPEGYCDAAKFIAILTWAALQPAKS